MSPISSIYSHLQLVSACPNNSTKERMENNTGETNINLPQNLSPPDTHTHTDKGFNLSLWLIWQMEHFSLTNTWEDPRFNAWSKNTHTRARTHAHTEKSLCATILSFTCALFPRRGGEQETRGKLLDQPSVSGGITSWEMRSDTGGGGLWLEPKPDGAAHPEVAFIQSGYWNQTVAPCAHAKLQGVFRNYRRQTGENNHSQKALVNNAAVCKWAAVIVLLLFLCRSLSVASEHDCYFIPSVTFALFIYLFPPFKPRETRTNGSRIKASQPHTFMWNITATKQAC